MIFFRKLLGTGFGGLGVEQPREVEHVHGIVRAHREREVHSETSGVEAEAVVPGSAFRAQGVGLRDLDLMGDLRDAVDAKTRGREPERICQAPRSA